MGKFEKFVVLTVLFLVTLILVVSLNTDEPETLAQASLGGVEEVEPVSIIEPTPAPVDLWKVEDVDEPEAEVEVDEEVFDPSTALLSGQAEEELEPVVSDFLLPEDLIELPEGAILQELKGLTATDDPNVFEVTVVVGEETYNSIALKYYKDASYADMIRQANDDPMIAPSEQDVMLPAFDMRVQRRDRVSGKSHLVKKGDTFGKIAQMFYGDAAEWKKIHEANKDKVSTEKGLRPGMILVIP